MAPRQDPPPFDLSRFRTKPLGGRGHKVETARFAAPVGLDAPARGAVGETGLGAALGDALLSRSPPHAGLSLLCCARRAGVPVTVHVAVGTDTVHMHPACDGAAVGAATHTDFRRLATLVEGM